MSLEEEKQRIVERLGQTDLGNNDYEKLLKHLQILNHIEQSEEKPKKWWQKIVDNPALVSSLTTIGGTAMVLYHERANVITSKAFSMVFKRGR